MSAPEPSGARGLDGDEPVAPHGQEPFAGGLDPFQQRQLRKTQNIDTRCARAPPPEDHEPAPVTGELCGHIAQERTDHLEWSRPIPAPHARIGSPVGQPFAIGAEREARSSLRCCPRSARTPAALSTSGAMRSAGSPEYRRAPTRRARARTPVSGSDLPRPVPAQRAAVPRCGASAALPAAPTRGSAPRADSRPPVRQERRKGGADGHTHLASSSAGLSFHRLAERLLERSQSTGIARSPGDVVCERRPVHKRPIGRPRSSQRRAACRS